MPNILAFIYLCMLAGGTFFSVLSGRYLLTERDLSVFFIPPRVLWSEAVRNLEFPLWNPYFFSGHPLLAVLQPGILYPPDLLLVVFPFDLAFNWIIVIHYIGAGIFMWLLIKELGSAGTGALLGAITFMLSGYLFSVHNVMSTLFTVAWVPLLMLLFLRTLRRASVSYAVFSGLVLACMFTGGGIEVFYVSVIFTVCHALFPRTFDYMCKRVEYPPLVNRLGLLIVAMAVFFLVSAVELLPFMELAGQSTRSGGLDYREATTWSLAFRDFIQFFIPDPFGYGVTDEKYWANQSWLKTIYTGTIPFILSFFFLFRFRRVALPFVFVIFLAVTLALGKDNPVYWLLYNYMPFFNKFRYPIKFIFMAFVFLSISTGLGYDCLRRLLIERMRRPGVIPYFFLVIATAGAVAFGALFYYDAPIREALSSGGFDYPEYNHISINLFNTKRALVFFILTSVVVYGAFKSMRLQRVLPLLLVLLLSVDLFFAHNGYYAVTEARTFHEKGEVMEFLEKDSSLYRVFVTPKTLKMPVVDPTRPDPEVLGEARSKSFNLEKERLMGYNLMHGIFDINGMEVMRRADYSSIYDMMVSQRTIDTTNILAMLNVKYVVSIPRIDSPEFELRKTVGTAVAEPEKLEELDVLKVYENKNFLPRFFLVNGYRVVKDAKEYHDILRDKGFEPASTVLLDEDPGLRPVPLAEGGPGSVEVAEYTLNTISLRVDTQRPAILVASESFYPGWKVYVNGLERKVLRADMVLRAVVLDRGVHEVMFVYDPWTFRLGRLVSIVTLAGFAVAGVVVILKRRMD